MGTSKKEWKGLGPAIRGQVEVPAAVDMDDETFLKHLELRHAKECKIENKLHRHAVWAWINSYRIFHDRLHSIAIPGQYDHVHAEEGES